MAKIVLLVGLFAFAAVQLSQAAPKPDDVTVEPAKSAVETKPPVPTLKSGDDFSIDPKEITMSSAEMYWATFDMDSLTWEPPNSTMPSNKWWEYVPRKNILLKLESGGDTSSVKSARPAPTVKAKAEVVEVSPGTTEVAAEVKA